MQNELIKPRPKTLDPTHYETIRQFMQLYPWLFVKSPEWLYDNWHIFVGFYARTCQLIYRGRTHYSARTIVEVMRHESVLEDTDKDFKISNNVSPDLGRAFVVINPAYADFWQYNRDGEEFKNTIELFAKERG